MGMRIFVMTMILTGIAAVLAGCPFSGKNPTGIQPYPGAVELSRGTSSGEKATISVVEYKTEAAPITVVRYYQEQYAQFRPSVREVAAEGMTVLEWELGGENRRVEVKVIEGETRIMLEFVRSR